MKLFVYCIQAACLIFLCTLVVSSVQAEYILPYPSYMPGNKLYKISRLFDSLRKVWSFGSIVSLKYQLSLSDKYLVEAKTLFDYKQYLLATDALKRSSSHIAYILPFLEKGTREGKDMRLFVQMVRNALMAHQEVLVRLRQDLPESFLWTPEKVAPSTLSLHKDIDEAIRLRVEVLSKL